MAGLLRGRLHAWAPLSILIVACAILAALMPHAALADEAEDAPVLSEAKSAIVCDQRGHVLFSKDPEAEMPMASITKVMTAMVALDSGRDLDEPCSIEVPSFQEDAQMAGYAATDTPTLRELLRSMLVYSANDAAYNVGVAVAGSEDAFVDLMNQKARQLGMDHTHFMNTHGLEEDGHYSCVEDLVTMGRYALENYPFIRNTVLSRSTTATVNGAEVSLPSTDHLMGTYAGLCGIKTGAVESGKGFLGACKRHGVTLYTCVLGCETDGGRFTDTASLMDWAFDHYGQQHLGRAGWIVRVVPWAQGFWRKLVVSPSRPQMGLAWSDERVVWSSTMTRPAQLVMPGGAYGTLRYTSGNRLVASSCYEVREGLYDLPAIDVFSLPLFLTPAQREALAS